MSKSEFRPNINTHLQSKFPDALVANRPFFQTRKFLFTPVDGKAVAPQKLGDMEVRFSPDGFLTPAALSITVAVETDVRAAKILSPEFRESFRKYIDLWRQAGQAVNLRAFGMMEDQLERYGINLSQSGRNGKNHELEFFSSNKSRQRFGWRGSRSALEHIFKKIPLDSPFYPMGVRGDPEKAKAYFYQQVLQSLEQSVQAVYPFAQKYGELFDQTGKFIAVYKRMLEQNGRHGYKNGSTIDRQVFGMPLKETMWYQGKVISDLQEETRKNPLAAWALTKVNGSQIRLADPIIGDPDKKGLIVVDKFDKDPNKYGPLYLYWNYRLQQLAATRNIDLGGQITSLIHSHKSHFYTQWYQYIRDHWIDFSISNGRQIIGNFDVSFEPLYLAGLKYPRTTFTLGTTVHSTDSLVRLAAEDILQKFDRVTMLLERFSRDYASQHKRQEVEKKKSQKQERRLGKNIYNKPHRSVPRENRRLSPYPSVHLVPNSRRKFLGKAIAFSVAGTSLVYLLRKPSAIPLVAKIFESADSPENNAGILLIVPELYSQLDGRWKNELLGNNTDNEYTIGGYGCLITALAIYLKALGQDIDPLKVNYILKERGGFSEGEGNFIWDKGAQNLGLQEIDRSGQYYKGPVDEEGLVFVRKYLDRGMPLLAWADFDIETEKNEQHYLLVIGYSIDPETGKQSYTYVDPWDGQAYTLNQKTFARKAIQFIVYDKELPTAVVSQTKKEQSAKKQTASKDDKEPKTFNTPREVVFGDKGTIIWTGEPMRRVFSESQWEAVRSWADIVDKFTSDDLVSRLQQEGYDLNLILAMIWVESLGNPEAYNKKSGAACGFQVIPSDNPNGYEWAKNRPTTQELLDKKNKCAKAGLAILEEAVKRAGSVRGGLDLYYSGSYDSGYGDLVIWLYKHIKK